MSRLRSSLAFLVAMVLLPACKDGNGGEWVAPDLRINELVASNRTGLQDASGAFPDWLEIFNNDDEVVDLSTYTITDDPLEPQKSPFPAGTEIAAGGFLIVFVDGDPSTVDEVHTSFKLSRLGETLQIVGPALQDLPVIDELQYPSMDTDVSWAWMDGGFEIDLTPTPGEPNG